MKSEYVSHYLTDNDIANFARQSFNKKAEDYSDEQNARLIRFLARGMSTEDWEVALHNISNEFNELDEIHFNAVELRNIATHWVPFGHPQITLRMQAPVPVRVQCFKHKIGFVESEESRRYISSQPEIYIPEFFRNAPDNAKQGSGEEHSESEHWIGIYKNMTTAAVEIYKLMIKDGICPEQARFILPQGAEVNWVWTGSLYSYANFYNQRINHMAQKEIQLLAAEVDKIIKPLFPVAWPALTSGAY